LEAVAGSRYQRRVKAYVREASLILGIAGTSIKSHHEKRKPDIGRDGSWEEFVIPVASP
jgi:hypothetical protein